MDEHYCRYKTTEDWNGEGLPPVGTVCEGRIRNSLGEEDWFECKVVAHHPDYPSAAITHGNGRLVGWCSEFRPIRTPEQIAAEERAQRIAELYNVITGPGDCWAQAARAIDAGYRRTE